jgi:glycosyltransferase involved in cell wall biosynthesis
MRGGEKVLEALLRLFPQADIFSLVYDTKKVSDLIRSKQVYTSFINRLPFASKWYQQYLPLMPQALQGFDLRGYDLVISSESGPAKGVVAQPGAYHLCYCHTPMRYIWDMYPDYYRESGIITRLGMRLFVPGLRAWDASTANLVDRFAANSAYVADRIRRYYGRESAVVNPPVAVEKYLEGERRPEDFYLFFGQLNGYKRADIAIEACVKTGRKIVVAGDGKPDKRWKGNRLVTFTGKLRDEEIAGYYAQAKALLFPGIEDFGIVPVEAMAAGCPVIAYKKGGAGETVLDGVTGLFFEEQNAASLIKALDRFEAAPGAFADRAAFRAHVAKFSEQVFAEKIKALLNERKRV